MVQLSHLYMTTGKTIALSMWTFLSKVMSLIFNMLSRFVIAFLPRTRSLPILFGYPPVNFYRLLQKWWQSIFFFFQKCTGPFQKVQPFMNFAESVKTQNRHGLTFWKPVFLEGVIWAFKVFHTAFWLYGDVLAESIMKTNAACLSTVSFLPSFNYWNLFFSQFAWIGFFNYKEPWRVNGVLLELH